MARTSLSAQTVTSAGAVISMTSANADGHSFTSTGLQVLRVKNGSASPIDVTVKTDVTRDGSLALPDRVVAVAAGAEKTIGPFDPNVYQQKSGSDQGKVLVNFSAVTTVTVALVSIG